MLEWVQYPEDTAATRTEYGYDSMYRLTSAAATTAAGKAMSVGYTYADDLLTSVKTPATTYSFTYGSFDLASSVKIGTRTLASYRYTDDRNYYLSGLDYGNGDRVQYSYDEKGRVVSATYEDGDSVKYTYDNSGTLATTADSSSGISSIYGYDYIDRISLYKETGTDIELTLEYSYYVSNGKLKTLLETINGKNRGASYIYDADERLSSYQKANGKRAYSYDAFDRVGAYVTTHKNSSGSFDTVLSTNFTFASSAVSTTSSRVAAMRNTATGYDTTYSYTYDGNGNILSVSDGTNTTTYVYDSQNQLVRENNQAGGFTHVWTYDRAGNILSRTEYAYTTGVLGSATATVSYGYGDSQWGDLLTSYNGQTVTSDAIGNTLSDGKRTYTWEHGRELATLTQNGVTWYNTYNADGLRTRRTDGTNTYSYVYYGGSLQYMQYNNTKLYFTHAPDGTPMGILYNNVAYFYITNLQGDVVGIVTNTGTPVVHYTYDAWGNVLSCSGSMAATLGAINPLRYRGYVYDTEMGLYYLQSRYYDPELGRFINADAFTSTSQGFTGNNMFAYCGNNPVVRNDSAGNYYKYLDINFPQSAIYSNLGGSAVGVSFGGGVSGGGASLGPIPVSPLTFPETHTVIEAIVDAKDAFGNLSYAESFGIKPYKKLRLETAGTGLQSHHIIEKRFADALSLEENDILSVAVTPQEHQAFTNGWRRFFPYRKEYSAVDDISIWTAAKTIYKDHPALLHAVWDMLSQ